MSGPQGLTPLDGRVRISLPQGSEQPPVWGPPAGSETPAWQPQAYPQQYQYGQPQGYPAAPPYGAPQTGAPEYNPYGQPVQPGQYGQPGPYGQPQYGQYRSPVGTPASRASTRVSPSSTTPTASPVARRPARSR